MLPFIDRVGRRNLLLIGSVTCMVVHFIIAGVMASRGNPVSNVNGDYNLTWEIKGSSGMAVIAFSYIFTGIYGLTWVRQYFLYYIRKRNMPLTISGSNRVGLRIRGLPIEIPSQRCRCFGCDKLDFQLCPGVLRGPRLPQHPMEDLYYLRCLLLRHDLPCVPHVPGDCRKVA